jgi:phosphohistidine phosphatase
MKLYCIRHAQAVDRDTEGVTSDAERTLTDSGKDTAKKVGKALAKLGIKFDLVLSSPLVRARQTAEIIAETLGADEPELVDGLKGPVNPSEIEDTIRKSSAENIALVGHTPSMDEYVSSLMFGKTTGMIKLRKASVCCVDLDSETSPLRGELQWLITAKQLKAVVG